MMIKSLLLVVVLVMHPYIPPGNPNNPCHDRGGIHKIEWSSDRPGHIVYCKDGSVWLVPKREEKEDD
jgi:hypothetical protein